MANTRTSAKRARQSVKRQARNTTVKSTTKTALKRALDAVKAGDLSKAKEAYMGAVKALGKASSKGVMPQRRAARKISRLTLMAKKALPDLLQSKK